MADFGNDNDMMPNDGSFWHPDEPEEQVIERRVSLSKAQAAKPMLEDLIAEFQKDIDQLQSVDSIEVNVLTEPEEFQKAWLVRQELLNYARGKKAYLESLLGTTQD